MKNFRDKKVVITGAGSGIGQATAIEFAARGADLVVSDINEEGLAKTIIAIEAKGGRALGHLADVSQPNEVESLINKAIETGGRIDILMNNAGVAVAGEIRHLALKDWQRVVAINLWGPIYGVHHALPHMIKQNSGHIINVSSAAGMLAGPGLSAYSTSKFGIVGFTEVLRNEISRYGIGVTLVCPGFVRTNIFSSLEVRGMKNDDEARKVPPFMGISKESCARNIVHAVEKNKFLIIPGPEMKVLYGVKRFAPDFISNNFSKLLALYFKRLSIE